MARRSVYKICECRDHLKCRHSWWFSYKRAGGEARIRKSLDAVLEKHIDSKTIAEVQAERLRIGIVDNTLPPRTRHLLGLPPSSVPVLPTMTMAQLLELYRERHLSRTATADKQAYQIGAITRTELPRPDGITAQFGEWLLADVTADTIERLRETRTQPTMRARAKGANRSGGKTAANRDLQLLRGAFNWAVLKKYVQETPFKIGTQTAVKLTTELARSRRLQEGEDERLLPACGRHLRELVEAALETGCRRGELLSLQVTQVQITPRAEIWLPAGKTKTGKARRVPISTRLRAILDMRLTALRTMLELEDDEALDDTLFVFGNEIGERIESIKTAWLSACRRAKIVGLRFHDLRREAGSRWMDAGVPLATIQKWLGHANISQTSRYLSTTTPGEHEAMRRFEERIGRLTRIDTDSTTPPQMASPDTTTSHDSLNKNTIHH